MVGNTRQNVSYKINKRRVVPEEEQIVVEGTHKAIIDMETWNKAKAWKANRFIAKTPKPGKPKAIFSGLIRCAGCGGTMSATAHKGKPAYRCGTYNNKGKSVCPPHTVREEVLEILVLNDIKTYAKMAKKDREKLVKEISQRLNSEKATSFKFIETQVSKNNSAISKINATVDNLYEDKIGGKLPEKIFYSMLQDYEKQLDKLAAKEKQLADQLAIEQAKLRDASRWASIVEQHLGLEKITREIALELIDKILVSGFYIENGKRHQDVTIYYNFVGSLETKKQRQMPLEKMAI